MMSSSKVNRINRIQRFRRPEYCPYDTAYAVNMIPPPVIPPEEPTGVWEPFSVPINLTFTISLDHAYFPGFGVFYINGGRRLDYAEIRIQQETFAGGTFVTLETLHLEAGHIGSARLWKERAHKITNNCERIQAVVQETDEDGHLIYVRRNFDLGGSSIATVTPTYTSVPNISYLYGCVNCGS